MRIFPALVLALVVARGALANCQLGGTFCGDPVAIDCNTGVVCFPPFRSCSGCTCTTTNEGKTCLANASEPGTVATLLVAKSAAPGDLDLVWSASCRPSATDYGIYEGALASWYSHEPLQCTSGGALSATIAPSGGDRYYLVVAISGDFIGSLGTSSAGAERPDNSLGSCGNDRALAPCP